jgi:hypothetical protein
VGGHDGRDEGHYHPQYGEKASKATNDGEFNAAKHLRLTFAGGIRVPGASNLTRLKKEVMRASTLWFASARCYEDELRDGIG